MWFSSSWKIHFFLKASFVLDDVEIKNTSCFIQNMFDLNYNKLLCSQTSESHVLNKPYIMLKFPWSCRNMRGKEEEDDFGSCSKYTELCLHGPSKKKDMSSMWLEYIANTSWYRGHCCWQMLLQNKALVPDRELESTYHNMHICSGTF